MGGMLMDKGGIYKLVVNQPRASMLIKLGQVFPTKAEALMAAITELIKAKKPIRKHYKSEKTRYSI
jgi:hypothetical protein